MLGFILSSRNCGKEIPAPPGRGAVQPALGDPASAGGGLGDPQRALPTPTILGFCEKFDFKAEGSAGAVRRPAVVLMIAEGRSEAGSPLGSAAPSSPLQGCSQTADPAHAPGPGWPGSPPAFASSPVSPRGGQPSQDTALAEDTSPADVLLLQTKERRRLQRAKIQQDLRDGRRLVGFSRCRLVLWRTPRFAPCFLLTASPWPDTQTQLSKLHPSVLVLPRKPLWLSRAWCYRELTGSLSKSWDVECPKPFPGRCCPAWPRVLVD